jgi:ribose transport system substrate-binding protein
VHEEKRKWRRAGRRPLALVAAVAAAAGAVSAFGGASASNAADSQHVSVAMELVLTGVQFAQNAALGMKTAAADAGNVSLTINGPPSVDPTLAQTQVTTELSQSPDAMGIDPFTPDLWQHTLSTVTGQVKNVLLMNDKPVVAPSQISSAVVKTYVGISDANYARALATATIKQAHLAASTAGIVLLGQCVPGSAGVLAERNTAFLQVIHKLLPKATVIQFNSQVVPSANTSAWTSELSAHPKAVLALGGCDQDGTSLYLVKRKLHLKVVAGGIDLTPQALEGVANGTLTATLVDDYFVQGYVATWLLAQAARGHALPQGWVNTGYTLVTKKNVAAVIKANASDAGSVAYWRPRARAIVNNLAAHTKPIADAWGGVTN